MEFKKKEEIVFLCFWFLFRARVLQLVNHLNTSFHFFCILAGLKSQGLELNVKKKIGSLTRW